MPRPARTGDPAAPRSRAGSTGSGWRASWPGAPVQGGAVDGDDLLGEQPLVEMADRFASRDPRAARQHARERRGNGLGPVVGAHLAARDAVEALDDVADGDGDDGEVAGEGFLDG